MRQYLDVKEQYPDCIVFFRLGDFYEMFFDDAVVVARALDLTLTSRDKNKENPIPMCGVPHHAAQHYLQKLVERGFKVAICEQVEDPKLVRGIVRREVVRVVTPGVVLEEEQLEPKTAHYLAAAVGHEGRVGLSYLDVTTGEFAATEVAESELVSELVRLEPREVLLAGLAVAPLRARMGAAYSELPAAGDRLELDRNRRAIEAALGRPIVGLELSPLAWAAAAEAVTYVRATQPRGALPVVRLIPYRPTEQLLLDEASRTNLELFRNLHGGGKVGSLLGIIDETKTAMGGRLLRRWLGAPLVNVAQIRRRHDAIEWLLDEPLRAELRAELGAMYDLERLAGRARLGVATPRDLVALAGTLERLPEVAARLRASFASNRGAGSGPPELLEVGEDTGADVAVAIRRVLVDEPPAQWREGGFCRPGFSAELDELFELSEGGKNRIAEIETRERERTRIQSLKVRYNRVFGYYLEITRANLDRVPPDYVRKQTLANAERFVTPELAEYEAKILHAEERRQALELEAFSALVATVGEAAERLLLLGEWVAWLDALAALAEVAHRSDYVRPVVDESLVLEIEDGRHPVVEKLAAAGKFVPNDVKLDPRTIQLVVVTGPNMAGKSTAMRQAALIVILAQMGSFVPARRARVGIVDRVFTRIGASDNVARGESTFMVEMRETANILRAATRRSLVVLDEIGRGTSTYDGLAIAWAVAEHLHDQIGCKTLFATHYHELCRLEETRERVRNVSTAVRQWKGEIVFLHKIVPGGASRSYGIHVAELAGIDRSVIGRAKAIVTALEHGEELAPTLAGGVGAQKELPLGAANEAASAPSPPKEPSAVERALRDVDIDGMSPREALALVAELQTRLKQD